MAGFEYQLFLVFCALIRGRDHHVVSAVYHAATNLSPKIDMVDAGLQWALYETPLLKEWQKLRGELRGKADERNVLAHYTLLGRPTSGDGVDLYLGRSILDVRIKDHKEYTLERVNEIAASFADLSSALSVFSEKLTKALPSRL